MPRVAGSCMGAERHSSPRCAAAFAAYLAVLCVPHLGGHCPDRDACATAVVYVQYTSAPKHHIENDLLALHYRCALRFDLCVG